MKKATRSEEQSRPHKANDNTPLSPRLRRLALALLDSPQGVTREEADRIAPASNGPHYIHFLRTKLGLEIPCERVPFTTRDGEGSWYGLYRLTRKDRKALREMLK